MAHSAAPKAARLSTGRILAFASPGIPGAALLLATGTYLPPFYTGFVGVSLIAYTFATVGVRLVDLTIDPILGWMMDRTKTRWGRFRPWYVVGVPISMLGVYMILNPQKGDGVGYLALWYFVVYIGLSITTVGHASWAASLAMDYHERSRIYGWMIALTPVGSVLLLLLPVMTHGQLVLGKPQSFHAISLMIVAAIPIATLLMVLFTPERPAREAPSQRFAFGDYVEMIRRPTMMRLILADLALTLGPGVTAPLYYFFFGQIKGFTREEISILLIFYIAAALLGGVAWARVARRFGKHRTLQIAAVCYAVTQTSLMITPKTLFLPTAFGMFLVGFSVSAFILLIRAMVADYADEVRLEQGKERAGVLYAMVTSTQKLGAAINVLLVFPLLQLVFHFDPKKPVNDEFALVGLQLCYLIAPAFFVLVGAALFFGYRLDETRHAEIRTALEQRDADLQDAIALDPSSSPTPAPAAAE